MSLPIFTTQDRNFSLMQTTWSSQLNSLLINPSLQCSILKSVTLAIGSNTINHLLGRKLQGWRLVRKRGPASIYDNQDANQYPDLSLILVSDTIVVVDIEVF